MPQNIELTILMPCLNEEANIGYAIKSAKRFLKDKHVSGEILVVDNMSKDNSVAIAKKLGAQVIQEKRPGYGIALRHGIQKAKGKYIIMGDCDTTYDLYNLMPFLTKLRQGIPMVVGNRYAGGIKKGAMPFTHKYIGIPVLSWMGRLRFKTDVRDFHCGLRGFDSKLAKCMKFETTGMEFATESIARFAQMGLCIAQVPTTLSISKKPRKPHLKTLKDGMRHLIYILLG